MDIDFVNLKKTGLIPDLHSYKLVAQLNNYPFKRIKAQRECIWHHHDDTDEMVMIVEGRIQIARHDRRPGLEEGNWLSFFRVWIINSPVMSAARYCRLNRREP
jgi:hypothetical protein